jgi:hypothetical protein
MKINYFVIRVLIIFSLITSGITGVANAVTDLPTDGRNARCELDFKAPKAWKVYQDKIYSQPGCPNPYRYLSTKLTTKLPNTKQSNRSELLNIERCKFNNYFEKQRVKQSRGEILGPNYTLQFVPFQTPDFKVNSNPQNDYKDWVQAMEDVMNKSSDLPFNFKIVVPNKYYKISNNLSSYDVGSKWITDKSGMPNKAIPNFTMLAKDVIAASDSEIDFSKSNHVWFVGPPNTKRKDLINFALSNKKIETQEKVISKPYVTDHPYNYDVDQSKGFDGSAVLGHMHEWGHSSGTFTIYGEVLGRPNQLIDWGIMFDKASDWLAVHKWVLQMISDDQVRCAPKNKTTIHWLKPSTINGSFEKLLIVPISSTKYLAVESIRPYGYSFKIPKCQLGALVYVISNWGSNNEKTIQIPTKTKKDYCFNATESELGALVKGDAISYEGVTISILESGDFGDVVQVKSKI